uniref:F-ATPase delta subunit n=1 Tax=Angiostrongylus cantonensis TaxID=6313 RepID=A0A0K0D0C3_ANGCA
MIARSICRAVAHTRRGFATAAASAQHPNTDELRLTFASPDTAFYNNDVVKQVDVPTLAGVVGVLANHVPTIGVLKPGVVSVIDLQGFFFEKFFVSSGTMSMNIDGTCQVLAEEVVRVDDIDQAAARAELEAAQRASVEGSDLSKAEAQIRAEV